VACPEVHEFNATFSSVFIGSVAGACNTGFAGTISRECRYDSTTGEAYWSEPNDPAACKLITCESEQYGFASWPLEVPSGQNIEVEGECLEGYEPTNPALGGPKRICQATGGYVAGITNECKRM